MSASDHFVVVMGPTGSGKSTFIATASGKNHNYISYGLRTVTSDIRTVKAKHPKDGHSVVFVDTPGFNDEFQSDTEILSQIADWLIKAYKENVKLTTIVYLHRISDNRMAGSLLKSLHMLASLCGQKAMPNLTIVTTMWSEVPEEAGARREEELKRCFWQDMLANRCRTKRFKDTFESAWDIVGKISDPALLLQTEIGDIRKSPTDTGSLREGLPRWLAALKDAILKSLTRWT